jgi:secreted trypsin-like serine protease
MAGKHRWVHGRAARASLAFCAIAALALSACGGSSDDKSAARTRRVASQQNFTPPTSRADAPEAASATPGGQDPNAVIAGSPIDVGAAAYTVALVTAGTPNAAYGQFCDGVLVDATTVMTAAHCVTPPNADGSFTIRDPATIDVVLGRTELSGGGGEVIRVGKVWLTSRYDKRTDVNDFAFLILKTPSSQPPILIPTATRTSLWQPGVTPRVTGWGCTVPRTECKSKRSQPGYTSHLNQALVQIADTATCAQDVTEYDNAVFDPQTMFCGQPPRGFEGRDCAGDSGGPLAVQATGDPRWWLVGLVSWGPSECQLGLSYYAVAPVGNTIPQNEWIICDDLAPGNCKMPV